VHQETEFEILPFFQFLQGLFIGWPYIISEFMLWLGSKLHEQGGQEEERVFHLKDSNWFSG
jgi:hypothetical protein